MRLSAIVGILNRETNTGKIKEEPVLKLLLYSMKRIAQGKKTNSRQIKANLLCSAIVDVIVVVVVVVVASSSLAKTDFQQKPASVVIHFFPQNTSFEDKNKTLGVVSSCRVLFLEGF